MAPPAAFLTAAVSMTATPQRPPANPATQKKRGRGRPRKRPLPASTSTPPPPPDPRRRVPSNPSALSRKYRPVALHPDELELVGDWPPPDRFPDDGGVSAAAAGSVANAVASADAAVKRGGGREGSWSKRYVTMTSRFPNSWPQVVQQACNATIDAMQQGHDRLLLGVSKPGLLARGMLRADGAMGNGWGQGAEGGLSAAEERQAWRGGKGGDGIGAAIADGPRPGAEGGVEKEGSGSPSLSSSRLYGNGLTTQLALTLDICHAIVMRLCAGHGETFGSRMRPLSKINLFFNDEKEAEFARRMALPAFKDRICHQVLSQSGPERSATDVCIVVAPSNRRGDPTRIEAVERIHYANWSDSNVVIMVNPELVALTGFTTVEGNPRPPCFLSDYIQCYYLDPQVFATKHATGAMLRCYPRKWESYMQRSSAAVRGFRLISESEDKPRRGKMLCEFGWRAAEYGVDTPKVR